MTARVLVIGNSFVGALMKAIEHDPARTAGYRFDFAASGGMLPSGVQAEFQDICIGADGRLRNIRFTDRFQTEPVHDYRAVFVYALLPSAHMLIDRRQRLEHKRFSSQVIEAALLDTIGATNLIPVYRRLKAATAVPVTVLSANTGSYFGPISDIDYAGAVALLRAVVGEDYMEMPRELYTDDFAPNIHFHKGSVNVLGGGVANEKQAKHDVNHLNESGGAVILAAMVARLRALGV